MIKHCTICNGRGSWMGYSKGKSVQVLGMLRIADDGEVESLALAHKPRTVLAMLVAHPDQVVSLPALVRELWGDHPPASALRVVQTYILQARKALSQATRLPIKVIIQEALTTHAGGYMFSESFARLDYRIYQGLVDSGRKALANGDLSAGVSYLGDALGIWRGSAFADVVVGRMLESRRRQYEESRLGALETLAEAKIEIGRHLEVTADLAALTTEYPYHEGLHSQYMRALEKAGRRAQALEVFHRLRVGLVSELGIEPGHTISRLQYSILNSSPVNGV
ncbi:regulatory protein DnrI [Streptomyces himastatinicus ATCC 53653]|uniref:Regulatory protein DnrI n=2 Tax=Streptomyces violaceusniger group TaxID=2839105 RepID=D9WMS0_9ACTN|nr:regulatory protein DnrI [Streptomyces himastatinicus ATCC 53653]